MIGILGKSPYRLNLIRELREKEKRKDRQKRLAIILGFGCFGFFALAVIYSALTIWQMESVLKHERDQVKRLQEEYQKYTASKLIVDKADVELLNELKNKGFLWTKKLAAIAQHLPDNYWITGFQFQNETIHVKGFGYSNYQQDHLLELDAYLNRLRKDTTFTNDFSKLQLHAAERKEEGGKVSFDFSAYTKNRKAQ